jgi:ABC-type maltose transport system permease subunit
MFYKDITFKQIITLLKTLIVLFIIYEIYKTIHTKLQAEQIAKLTPEEQLKFLELDSKLTPTEKAKIKYPDYYENQKDFSNFFKNIFK